MLFFIEENLSINFLKKQIFIERNEMGSVQLIFMKNFVKKSLAYLPEIFWVGICSGTCLD